MKKLKFFAAGMIVASMLGQNLAMAYDISKFNSLSPEAQKARSILRERIGNMSEEAQLKLSYRLYKKVFKFLPKLEKMSDGEFNSKLNGKIQNTTIENASVDVLTQEDMGGVIPDSNEIQGLSSVGSPANTAKHSEVIQSVRNVIEQIGYSDQSNGKRKPLTETQFRERIMQLSVADQARQGRSVASINETLSTILEILLVIVIIAAAVGLIVALGWMGVTIVLGCIVVTFLVLLVALFSAIGSGLMGR